MTRQNTVLAVLIKKMKKEKKEYETKKNYPILLAHIRCPAVSKNILDNASAC